MALLCKLSQLPVSHGNSPPERRKKETEVEHLFQIAKGNISKSPQNKKEQLHDWGTRDQRPNISSSGQQQHWVGPESAGSRKPQLERLVPQVTLMSWSNLSTPCLVCLMPVAWMYLKCLIDAKELEVQLKQEPVQRTMLSECHFSSSLMLGCPHAWNSAIYIFNLCFPVRQKSDTLDHFFIPESHFWTEKWYSLFHTPPCLAIYQSALKLYLQISGFFWVTLIPRFGRQLS